MCKINILYSKPCPKAKVAVFGNYEQFSDSEVVVKCLDGLVEKCFYD